MDSQAVIYVCSHRTGSNSLDAGRFLREGIQSAGGDAEIIELRGKTVNHCLACGKCFDHPEHRCVFHHKDQAEFLFGPLRSASLFFFVSPIYFYGPPSLLKTWIDRSQRFWAAREKGDERILNLPKRKAFTVMHAGRPEGEKLFTGTELILKYFLANFNVTCEEPLVFRGVDNAGDYAANSDAERKLTECGRDAWAAFAPKKS